MLREPEKELDAAPVDTSWPEVLNDPAVTELVAVNDLDMFNDPAKEEEPVPLKTALPDAEAVENSNTLNWVLAAEKVQLPVMVSLADLDAGPLVQSNLTYEVEEALVTVKCPPSKVKVSIWEEVWAESPV